MFEINNRIKELRETNNLTKSKFAEMLGIHRQRIQDIEGCRQGVPQEILMKCVETFGLRIDWLMTGEGEKYAKNDAVKEPGASYGAGILERIDSRDESIAKKMDLMMAEIMKLSQTVQQLEKKLEAA
jgi:transcriptional regulator with XRE-family HTH domain